MIPLIDPRLGDVEDDASSTKQRSLLGIAGSLLAEINLPKLALAWALLIVLPAVLLGLAPLIASGWLATLSRKIAAPLSGTWPLLVLVLVLALGWIGGRRLVRGVERGFWSLNSLAVQPGYALCREALRHLAENLPMPQAGAEQRARLRASAALGAGIILCGIALWVVTLAWPDALDRRGRRPRPPLPTHRPGAGQRRRLLSAYLAAAALVWGSPTRRWIKSTTSPPSIRRRAADVARRASVGPARRRRALRLPDRGGRAGPRGNGRLARVLARLDAIHAERPLDLVLITGDMTDAGRPRNGRSSSRRSPTIRGWRSVPSSCPAITTSMSSTAPTPRGSIFRRARASACARCAPSRPLPRCRATGSGSSIPRRDD
jgi:hypothetical protein